MSRWQDQLTQLTTQLTQQIERPKWDQLFMMSAVLVSSRSTCCRIQTGTLFVKDDRIRSIGYNGVCAGNQHCRDYWHQRWQSEHTDVYPTFEAFLSSSLFQEAHHQNEVVQEVHGEVNAIAYAARNGIGLDGCTVYTVYSPCFRCARQLVSVGVRRVVYLELYEREKAAVTFLKNHGIQVESYSHTGAES